MRWISQRQQLLRGSQDRDEDGEQDPDSTHHHISGLLHRRHDDRMRQLSATRARRMEGTLIHREDESEMTMTFVVLAVLLALAIGWVVGVLTVGYYMQCVPLTV